MIDYSELLSEGRIKRGRFSRKQVRDSLEIAKRDLETARAIIERSPEWALNIAYNAMHQAGRAFMFGAGYRPVGQGHHVTVVRFLEMGLGAQYADMLAIMDRMRRNRNRATYDLAGTISRKQAVEAIAVAGEFVPEIGRMVRPSGKK
ncbi:MAG: HEPN domain-containing protein [Candidatus Brocadiae bacterium]|nr:HEPN domain-containing protein [Candidatus Brocadiia bacterium]